MIYEGQAQSSFREEKPIPRLLSDLAYCRSVRVGNMWLPPEALTKHLSKYCPHIFCLTQHPIFPYSLRGSGSAVRIDNQHFVFLFKHQVSDFQPDEIAIDPVGDGARFVTGSQYYFVNDDISTDDDLTDLCAIGFELEKYRVEHFGTRFLKSASCDIWPHNTQGLFLIYGFPSCLQRVCPEGTSIAGTCVYVTAQYAGKSHSRYVHRLTLTRHGRWDHDGLSGGLVLHLGRDRRGFFVGLAGFLVRGGSETEAVHFVEAKAAHLLASQILR